jgi:hypothetical protein
VGAVRQPDLAGAGLLHDVQQRGVGRVGEALGGRGQPLQGLPQRVGLAGVTVGGFTGGAGVRIAF